MSSTSSRTACRRSASEDDREREEDGGGGEAERDGEAAAARWRNTRPTSTRGAGRASIDPLIGRKLEVERTIEILCRRRKNNPLYVGEAGVGKTAIAEGLARLIVEGQVPEVLPDCTIYCARHGRADRRHQIPRRFREAPEGGDQPKLKKQPGAILFIDEIHTVIGAGAASGGVMDASNLIKPVLANGELRCIGSTTYRNTAASSRRTTRWRGASRRSTWPSPRSQDTVEILRGLKSRYEEHHGIKYEDDALRAAAELAGAAHQRAPPARQGHRRGR